MAFNAGFPISVLVVGGALSPIQEHTSFNCQDLRENLSEETGLQQLQEHRLKHRKNPLTG